MRRPIEALEQRRLLAADLVDGALLVTATDAPDVISVTYDSFLDGIVLNVNGEVIRYTGQSVSSLQIAAGDGDDRIEIDQALIRPASVDGGAGNDFIQTGLADDTILGGAGNDTLAAQGGDDVLHGGLGDDQLDGGGGADDYWGDDGVNTLMALDDTDCIDGIPVAGEDDARGPKDKPIHGRSHVFDGFDSFRDWLDARRDDAHDHGVRQGRHEG